MTPLPAFRILEPFSALEGNMVRASRTSQRLLLSAALVAAAACNDTTGPSAPPPPVPPGDLSSGLGTGRDRLFSDAELATPADASPAAVPDAWSTWIQDNARPIRSLIAQRYEDLEFMKTVLGERRLVQMGESGHGVREFNQAKVRLIRFLHEEMGFDVIAFESGLYECWNADRTAATAPADSVMRRCIFGVWHTEEVLELFQYIRETHATNRPLRLAGFDVQFSSMADTSSAQFLFDAAAHVDPVYAERIRALESGFGRDYRRLTGWVATVEAWRDSMTAVVTRGNLIAAYDSVLAFLRTNEDAIAATSGSRTIALIARQTAFSRSRFVRQISASGGAVGFETRDEGMADNVDFLLDELYPGEKIIAWAHNAHIQHDRQSMRPVSGFGSYTRSMGTWVSQRHRPELYTIGLFMYTGSAAMNDRRVYTIARPLPNSIEALFYRGRMKWLFADMLAAPRSAGTDWMYTYVVCKEWGVNDYRVVPRDQYDGILFIHSVSPPQYR